MEELNGVSKQEEVNDGIDYIEALKEMKQNSVSKEAYDKVKAENKKLLESLVSGKEIDIEKEQPVDVNELRKKLFSSDNTLSNLEYVETALKLREALIESGEPDPFLPIGEKVIVSEEDRQTAERVAKELQDMVDVADGNMAVFNNEYQRRVVDSISAVSKNRRR